MKRLFVIALSLIVLAGCDNSPEAKEKAKKRDAIDYCWSTHEKKSISEAEKRFIASACEKMEDDFKSKYGVNP